MKGFKNGLVGRCERVDAIGSGALCVWPQKAAKGCKGAPEKSGGLSLRIANDVQAGANATGRGAGLQLAGAKLQPGGSLEVLLLFQEQIKGPENASIARFDGLGCYQTRSE